MAKLTLVLLLFSQFIFAQKTYKVTEGELQFVHFQQGIIIKKNDNFYKLEIKVDFELKQNKMYSVLTPIKNNDIETLYKSKKLVLKDEIDDKFDFKNLLNNEFIIKDDDNDDTWSKFCQINNNYFALFSNEYRDEKIYTQLNEILPYIYIQFGNKRIIYTYENEKLFLIPSKKKICFLGSYIFNPNCKQKKKRLSNKEIYDFSEHVFPKLENDFFRIDTIENKKVQLKNIYNEVIINKNYDSIKLAPIISCYKNGKIDLYNLTFNKLNKHPLKVYKIGRGGGSIQVIEKNKSKIINWAGKEIKKPIYYGYIDLNYYENSKEYSLEVSIEKRNNNFIFFARNLNLFGAETDETVKDNITLINTKDIKKFYFSKISKDTISKRGTIITDDSLKSKIIDKIDFNNDLVYYEKLDGTFGLNYLGYFISKEDNFYGNIFDIISLEEYQNLQNIEYKFSLYKMKRNNLYNLFPLQKDFKYKSLEDFKFGFARFELPNGKKGWLDLEGIEYLDD